MCVKIEIKRATLRAPSPPLIRRTNYCSGYGEETIEPFLNTEASSSVRSLALGLHQWADKKLLRGLGNKAPINGLIIRLARGAQERRGREEAEEKVDRLEDQLSEANRQAGRGKHEPRRPKEKSKRRREKSVNGK